MTTGPVQIAVRRQGETLGEFIRFARCYSSGEAKGRPVACLLITEGRFPQILDLFQGLKIRVPSGCLGDTLIFK